MTALDSILRALGRAGNTAAPRRSTILLSPKERQDALKLIARAKRQLRLLERQFECGLRIRQDAESAPERVDRLAAILDLASVASHVRAAATRAAQREHPAGYLVVPDLLPAVLLVAAREATPADDFFVAADEGYGEIAVPFGVMPLVSVATWGFVATLIKAAVLPVLLDVFRGSLDEPATRCVAPPHGGNLAVLHGRLVRWPPTDRRHIGSRPSPGLVLIVNVGEQPHRLDLREESAAAMEIVLPPGGAVAYVVRAGREASVVGSAAGLAVSYTYEALIAFEPPAGRAVAASER